MKKITMFMFFVTMFFTDPSHLWAAPQAEGPHLVEAIAADLCPDESGLWCVAINMPPHVGFFKKSPDGEIVYGPTSRTHVEKVKVVFPPDFDRWDITQTEAVLAVYNNAAGPEKSSVKTEYRGFSVIDTNEKLVVKKSGNTIQFSTATETSVGTSWGLAAAYLFFCCAFFDAGSRFGQRKKTRQEFADKSVNVPASFTRFIYPANATAGWLAAAASILVAFALVSWFALGKDETEMAIGMVITFSASAASFSICAAGLRERAEQNKKGIELHGINDAVWVNCRVDKMLNNYRRSALAALIAILMIYASLCLIGGLRLLAISLPLVAFTFLGAAAIGHLLSRKQKIADTSEKA